MYTYTATLISTCWNRTLLWANYSTNFAGLNRMFQLRRSLSAAQLNYYYMKNCCSADKDLHSWNVLFSLIKFMSFSQKSVLFLFQLLLIVTMSFQDLIFPCTLYNPPPPPLPFLKLSLTSSWQKGVEQLRNSPQTTGNAMMCRSWDAFFRQRLNSPSNWR